MLVPAQRSLQNDGKKMKTKIKKENAFILGTDYSKINVSPGMYRSA